VVAPTISTQPANVAVIAGAGASFTVAASGTAPFTYQWQKAGVAISGATAATYSIATTQTSDAGSYVCVVTNAGGSATSNAAVLSVSATVAPTVAVTPASTTVAAGGTASFAVSTSTAGTVTYQWTKNGTTISNATSASYSLANVQPANAGLYRAVIANTVGSTTSDPFILGVSTTSKVIGTGSEIGPNITHQNGHIYDQVLLTGSAATATADADQVLRISFIDLSDDIVQVEFSGAGTLSIVLDSATGPAAPTKYNQSGVSYMRGLAGITVVGADESSNLTIFSVGRITAVNQALFSSDVTYDGVADIGFVAISSTNGKFGGLRASNASFSHTRGVTGVYAPGVVFSGPVYLGDINGFDAATAMLVVGLATDVRITGGDLLQSNSGAVQIKGFTQLLFRDGTTSHGTLLPGQINKGRLLQDGIDVTTQVVVNP
jgi:hypothetical protein